MQCCNSEANICLSPGQETPHILWNPKFLYRIHNPPQTGLYPGPDQSTIFIQILISCIFRTIFSKQSLVVKFSHQNPTHTFLSYTLHMTLPSLLLQWITFMTPANKHILWSYSLSSFSVLLFLHHDNDVYPLQVYEMESHFFSVDTRHYFAIGPIVMSASWKNLIRTYE